MTINTDLDFASMDEFYLDPMNLRLGRHNTERQVAQEEILEQMRCWVLEELALSYLESREFWSYEALIVVEEELYGKPRLIVVEGNRRLAALKYLHDAYEEQPVTGNWATMVNKFPEPPPELFSKVPYILVPSRKEVHAFIGFRHVTGIKQWNAEEKAEFIARLIDEHSMTYEQVGHQIGWRTRSVRLHYIAYRVLLQIKDVVEELDFQQVKDQFVLLYFSIDTEGVKQYLQIDMTADSQSAKNPVPNSHLKNLANFSRWLFGTKDQFSIVMHTGRVNEFGRALESAEAISYLEQSSNPLLDIALRIADENEDTVLLLVAEATHNLEFALSRAYHYKGSPKIKQALQRLNNLRIFTP